MNNLREHNSDLKGTCPSGSPWLRGSRKPELRGDYGHVREDATRMPDENQRCEIKD